VAAAQNIENLLCWAQYLGADAAAGDQGNAVVRRHAVDCGKAVREASKTRCGSAL
jgi:hypothetical protein